MSLSPGEHNTKSDVMREDKDVPETHSHNSLIATILSNKTTDFVQKVFATHISKVAREEEIRFVTEAIRSEKPRLLWDKVQ